MLKTASWLLLTLIWVSPALGRDPANPEAAVPTANYTPITSGTKSYRPVEPMPWGDVNRRVMPKDAQPSPAPDHGKAAPKATEEKQHGRH